MRRVVEPELLDSLPFDDPEALRSRREIGLLNCLMGNHRWIRNVLMDHLHANERVLEVGAGSGDLIRSLRKKTDRLKGVRVDGLDLCPAPRRNSNGSAWHQADALDFERYHDYAVVLANLFLHQLGDGELAELGNRLSRTSRLIVAREPTRRKVHVTQFKCLSVLGIGRVTRHDAPVSIRAGFLDDELPHLLGLDPEIWEWECRSGRMGQYSMLAKRKVGL